MGYNARRKGGGSVITPDLFPQTAPPVQRSTMNGKPVFSVPAKSVLNLDSGFKHKLLCGGPTFSAGSACAYSCEYCYVEDLMRKNPHWQAVQAQQSGTAFADVVIRRAGAVDALRRQLTFADGQPRFNDPSDRRVIYASPLVDVAANMELVRETVEACKVILALTHWHIRLLSKSNLLPKVAAELPPDRIIYGVSAGTLDDGLAKAFERGTPLVSKRIESLHWLQDRGFRTFGMVCPSLPQVDCAEFSGTMMRAIRADRCEHVWGEVINLRGDSFTRTIHALTLAGYVDQAVRVTKVCEDKEVWEDYARATFDAHAYELRRHTGPDGKPKLRFLQYVTAQSKPWWKAREADGAILL